MRFLNLIRFKVVVVLLFLFTACAVSPPKYYPQPPPEKAAKVAVSYKGVTVLGHVATFSEVDRCRGEFVNFREVAVGDSVYT